MTNVDLPLAGYLQWLAIEKGRSRATIDAYGRDIARLRRWMADHDIALADLTDSQLEHYVTDLRNAGLAESSLARNIASIRGWLQFLFLEKQLEADPSQRLHANSRRRSLPKPLGEEEVARLIDSICIESPIDRRDRALLELLYGTGARVSEVVTLQLEDLDFDEELIRLTGKGARQRLVPMGSSLTLALKDYLGPSGRDAIRQIRRTSRVFLNSRGAPISRQGIDLVIDKRALAAGVDRSRVSAHVFRHSCATHMLAHGADIRVVQELLGHASIATTQIYTAVAVSSLKREYTNAHPRAHD
ncbi:MAG TPA: tyrosine recombinase [Acidimicrobiales bacterium]|nr:tyrosine recombinase [Acidimicrobiales bacterium]